MTARDDLRVPLALAWGLLGRPLAELDGLLDEYDTEHRDQVLAEGAGLLRQHRGDINTDLPWWDTRDRDTAAQLLLNARTAAARCTCGRIAAGMTVTEAREWNPDCQEHGTSSAWWNSPEQQAARAARRAESLVLQARARKARKTARTTIAPTTQES